MLTNQDKAYLKAQMDKGMSYDDAFKKLKSVKAKITPTTTSSMSASIKSEGTMTNIDTMGANKPEWKDLPSNIIPSAKNLASSVATAVLNPVDTLKGLGSIAVGGVEKLIPGEQESESSFDATVDFFKQRYGGLENIKNTIITDPVGFITDFASLAGAVKGGVKGAVTALERQMVKEGIELTPEVSNFIAKANKAADFAGKAEAVNPIGLSVDAAKPVFSYLTEKAGKIKDFTVENLASLPQNTIEVIKTLPNQFKNAWEGSTTRVSLGEKLKSAINDVFSEKSEIASAYKPIRASASTFSYPKEALSEVLGEFGLKIGKNNNVEEISANSSKLLDSDLPKVQEAIDYLQKTKKFTADAGLNVRQKLDDLVDWEKPTNKANDVIKKLRGGFDKVMGENVKGLKDIDARFREKIVELNRIKKEYLDKTTGELKDSVLNKIASATKLGKDPILKRMEELVPNISDDIEALKIVEQIKNPSQAEMIKRIGGGGAAALGFGALTGDFQAASLAALTKAFIATPENVISALQKIGEAKGLAKEAVLELVDKLKSFSGLDEAQLDALTDLSKAIYNKVDAGKAGSVLSIPDRANLPESGESESSPNN